jgi:hypothetical protein
MCIPAVWHEVIDFVFFARTPLAANSGRASPMTARHNTAAAAKSCN